LEQLERASERFAEDSSYESTLRHEAAMDTLHHIMTNSKSEREKRQAAKDLAMLTKDDVETGQTVHYDQYTDAELIVTMLGAKVKAVGIADDRLRAIADSFAADKKGESCEEESLSLGLVEPLESDSPAV